MTPTLYKATRLDGTDFRIGSIDYAAAFASGETIKHPAGSAGLAPGWPETYLSVSTEPTDCTGVRWPCRLFRVEAVGQAQCVPYMPHKRACHALRVVEELPAYEVFGPQGAEVVALIERAGRLTPGDMHRLADAARHAARHVVPWDAAWDTTDRRRALDDDAGEAVDDATLARYGAESRDVAEAERMRRLRRQVERMPMVLLELERVGLGPVVWRHMTSMERASMHLERIAKSAPGLGTR